MVENESYLFKITYYSGIFSAPWTRSIIRECKSQAMPHTPWTWSVHPRMWRSDCQCFVNVDPALVNTELKRHTLQKHGGKPHECEYNFDCTRLQQNTEQNFIKWTLGIHSEPCELKPDMQLYQKQCFRLNRTIIIWFRGLLDLKSAKAH